jgi:hypothetical protein
MSVSMDGFIADRDGRFGWSVPGEDQFRFHAEQIADLGGCVLGRKLYETMLPWETDPAMRNTELDTDFAELWSDIPKVVFSRTLDSVQGNARLSERSIRAWSTSGFGVRASSYLSGYRNPGDQQDASGSAEDVYEQRSSTEPLALRRIAVSPELFQM